jgi:carbonic anhydrase
MFCSTISKGLIKSVRSQMRVGDICSRMSSSKVLSTSSTCSCCNNLVCFKPKKLIKSSFRNMSSNVEDHDDNLDALLDNNKKWVEEMKKDDPSYFDKVGAPQKPRYLYIGCADSRVPANQIIGLGPGEVFVHRNVGNLVPATDLNSLSVIEYAVGHLHVKDIIVTGHYDCGAVRAALKTQDLGMIENWLRCIRDVYRLHGDQLDMIEDDEERHRRLVEINVVETCMNIFKTGVVQRKRIQTANEEGGAYPRIHALVFDPKVGILNKLPINFKRRMGNFKHIYDLYEDHKLA